jgi:HAD superfamily hydrolase (TIGR01459 family)|tara:strand:+ start:934 stop:1806 length:873 start_codon:yes stop_codon:yes gene_type:complete
MSQIITSLAEISDRYDALFCDLWGCVHDGLTPFADAISAMQSFRTKGGTVMLVTNAPRPHAPVRKQLQRIGVPDNAYDGIATSGDSARAAMFRGAVGQNIYFIGQTHDQDFFSPLELVEDPKTITQVTLEEAEGIVCCGPFDPLADLQEMQPQLLFAKSKGLKLLCANPDIVVDRGNTREWCAGALAKLYTEIGGESLYFGKPHSPIYDLARLRLNTLGKSIPDSRILCVGDGVLTDIDGALGEELDSLFITGGLAARETKTVDQPEPQALEAYLTQEMMQPTYSIGKLR